MRQGLQRHERNSVFEVYLQGTRHFDGETCLSHTARAGKCQESDSGVSQHLTRHGDLPSPSHEGGQRPWQLGSTMRGIRAVNGADKSSPFLLGEAERLCQRFGSRR